MFRKKKTFFSFTRGPVFAMNRHCVYIIVILISDYSVKTLTVKISYDHDSGDEVYIFFENGGTTSTSDII